MNVRKLLSSILFLGVVSSLSAQVTTYRFTNQDVVINTTAEIRTLFSMSNVGKYAGTHSWSFLVANSDGFYGVPSNAIDIWEYPNNGSSSYQSSLRRFSIMTGRDRTTAPNPVIIGGNGSLYVGYTGASTTHYNDLSVNGNVGIGTINSGGYKLAVNGAIKAKEVKVTVAAADWPDFVFENDYELLSLDEVKSHIRENKHLPGVPSAKEIEENGVSLGDMNAKLLQKIEELTLYVIQLQEEVNILKAKKSE